MFDVIDLFNEQDTRDEIGIGAIRDAFADRLFPGTCADRGQRSGIRGQLEENSAMSVGRIVDQYVSTWRFGSSNLYWPERTSMESSGRRPGPGSSDCRAASTGRALAPGGSGSFPSRSRATIRPWAALARQPSIRMWTWIRLNHPVSSTGIPGSSRVSRVSRGLIPSHAPGGQLLTPGPHSAVSSRNTAGLPGVNRRQYLETIPVPGICRRRFGSHHLSKVLLRTPETFPGPYTTPIHLTICRMVPIRGSGAYPRYESMP